MNELLSVEVAHMITYNFLSGSVDKSVVIRIVDSVDGTPETGVVWNTSGIDLQYRREGQTSTAITEASLSALTDAHTDGGFLHIGNGYYRLDLPDLAVSGTGTLVHGTVTGMVVIGCYINLDTLNVNVRQWLGGVVTTPTVSGVPHINVTHINGTTAGVAALKTAFDDTAGPVPHMGIVDQGTLQSATSTTAVLRSALALADDIVIGCQLQIVSGTGAGQTRGVSDYVSATDTATVDAAWTTTPDSTSVYKLWAGAPAPTVPAAVNVTQFGGAAGAFAGGRPEVNMTHIAGAAVSATTAQIGANIVQISGDATSADNLELYTDGTTPIPANVTQISGDATAADNLETALDDTAGPVPWTGVLDQGTAQSATSTTLVLRAAVAFGDDVLNGCILMALGSTQGYWQSRQITDYVSSTDTATVDAWAVTPSGTITYKVLTAQTGLASAAAVTDLSSRLPATLVSGRIDAAVGSMANNVMTAAAAASDLTTELQSGMATAAALATAQSDLDDIQTRLPAALVGGRMDVSVGAFAANTGMSAIRTATAQAGAAGTVTLDASASSTDDLYNDHDIVLVSGTGTGQRRHIADYAGSTKIATIRPNWATTPDATSTFVILSATSPWDQAMADHLDSGSAGSSLNAAGSAGDPWTTPLPGAYGAGTAGKIIGDNINATVGSRASQTSLDTVDDLLDTEVADIRARLPAALVGGRMDVSVGAMAANVITATATATDYLDEVADAVHDEVVDGSTTHRQSVRLQNAALGGKASGMGSTAVAFRDLADTKDRVTAVVDSEGNRSSVTRDLS